MLIEVSEDDSFNNTQKFCKPPCKYTVNHKIMKRSWFFWEGKVWRTLCENAEVFFDHELVTVFLGIVIRKDKRLLFFLRLIIIRCLKNERWSIFVNYTSSIHHIAGRTRSFTYVPDFCCILIDCFINDQRY